MKFLVLVSLLIAAEAGSLRNYNSQAQNGFFGGSSGINNAGGFFGQSGNNNLGFSGQSTGTGFSAGSSNCRNGEVRHVDGSCVVPEVTRNFFGITVPEQPRSPGSIPHIPLPKVEHNVLFVRLPEGAAGGDPIVIPPPRQNNVVYLLKKNSGQDGRVINIPAPEKTNPEVFFVNYNPNENPTLPGGIDLQTALNAASQGTGQVIGSTQGGQGFASGSSNFGTSGGSNFGSFGGSSFGSSGGSSFGSSGGSSFGSSGGSSFGSSGGSSFGSSGGSSFGSSGSNNFGSFGGSNIASSGSGSYSYH